MKRDGPPTRTGRMDRLFGAVMEACERPVAERLQGSADAELVRDALAAELPGLLQNVMARVYVTEFHRFRERARLPADDESSQALDAFADQLTAATITAWFDELPVLERLVTTVVSRRATELDRVAASLRVDLSDGSLVRAGLLAPGHGAAARIRGLGSDLHNGGRIVCRVHLQSGESVVYKPRPLGVERIAARVFEEISSASGIDVARCVPRSIDRGDYGWQEFVAPSPLAGRDAAGSYFEKLGVVAAIMGILGSVDMHHENIVARADAPVLVDLETFLHADKAIAEVNIANGLLATLKRSVVGTLLLPQRLPSGPYSVLMAGIGVPSEQRSERDDFVLVNDGTDAIDIARRRFHIQHTTNIPFDADGVRYSTIECADEFTQGFERGYEACVACAQPLRAILAEPVPVRHILRSTAIYFRVFCAATHPDYMRSEDEFRRILRLLGAPSGFEARAQSEFVVGEEMAALACADIPYFSVRSDDIRLEGRDASSLPVFDMSPRARALEGLADARRRSPALSRYLIEIGLDELGGAMQRAPRLSRRTFDGVVTPDGVSWREAARRLKALAVRTPAAGGEEVGWLAAGYGESTGTFDLTPSVSLHDGGGIEILFSRIDATMPDHADAEFTASLRRGIDWLGLRFRDMLEPNLASIVSGPASLTYLRTASAPRSPALEALCERTLAAEIERPIDMLTGVPGYGLALAGYPDTPEDLLARLLEVTEAAIDGPNAPTREPWNLAHGELGLVWALHRLASRLGDDDAITRAVDRFEQILDAAVDIAPSWCNGAAGLVMVGGEVLTGDPGDDERLSSLAQRMIVVDRDGPIDVSVCHGVGGVLQTLVSHARRCGEEWPLELAEDHLRQVARAIARSGYVTGVPDRTNLPGYFLGWSGLADSALLLELERQGRPSWVPLAFAPAPALVVAP